MDMPGYGFAARSGDEQRQWTKMIETFLAARGNLIGLILVMDVRRDWSQDEENLIRWLSPRGLPALVVLTKADKISRSETLKRVRDVQKASGAEKVLPTSSLKKTGVSEIEDYVYRTWVKPLREQAEEPADDESVEDAKEE